MPGQASKNDTIQQIGLALRRGETTSHNLTADYLRKVKRKDERLGAFLSVFEEVSLEEASRADLELQAGRDRGPLHGIPFGIKDILFTREGRTSAQSLAADIDWPCEDGPVIRRLRSAGAIILGKTSTMEYAAGLPDSTKPFPIPRNPWNLEYWAGGSSSGSASAVASGFVAAAIGTDTGGSVRIPASYCGITGLKPTFGLVPKSGCIPLAYSLDTIGPMASSAYDCALVLQEIAGHDPSDHSSLRAAIPNYTELLNGDVSGLRIGVDVRRRPSVDPTVDAAFDGAIATLAELGAQVFEVVLPKHDELMLAYSVVLGSEALSYHRSRLGLKWDKYSLGAKLMFAEAAFYSAADYVKSQRVRAAVSAEALGIFRNVDVVASLTSYAEPPLLAELEKDPSSWIQNVSTRYWSALGNTAISIPIGLSVNGLPIGMQLAAAPLREQTLLRVADAYQRQVDTHERIARGTAVDGS
ncbi:amidase [Streptomyces sp. NPDC002917]|uniref:amidase n=1 Tax=Streptomyces sp. NPDC002917 TaxID=3364671 RepID=UPI003674FA67